MLIARDNDSAFDHINVHPKYTVNAYLCHPCYSSLIVIFFTFEIHKYTLEQKMKYALKYLQHNILFISFTLSITDVCYNRSIVNR